MWEASLWCYFIGHVVSLPGEDVVAKAKKSIIEKGMKIWSYVKSL
jgi:hypothetical protein